MKATIEFKGELTGLSDQILHGWAYRVDDLQQRLVIEIYADDEPIALTRAELWLPELQDQHIGDGCYGFMVILDEKTLAFSQRLQAKVANTNQWLPNRIDIAHTEDVNVPVFGHVTCHHGLKIDGWLWNPAKPNQVIELRIYEDHHLIAEIPANQLRYDLIEHGVGNGEHGFSYTLPLRLADGRPHEIRVVDEQGRSLAGSPLTVIDYPQGFEYEVEQLACSHNEKQFLRALSCRYQHYVPASLAFSAYKEWHDRFASPRQNNHLIESVSFLLIVTGDSPRQCITLESLVKLQYLNVNILFQAHGHVLTDSHAEDARIERVAPHDWETVLSARLKKHQGILAFIESGDTLESLALCQMATVFQDQGFKIAYSDCDYANNGEMMPWFKPDWDLDLFLATPLIHHFFCMRSELIQEMPIEALISPLNWPWLAMSKIGDDPDAIHHVPRVLYHRNQAYALVNASAKVVRVCCERLVPQATFIPAMPSQGFRQLNWQQPQQWPRVSLIIPTRDECALLERCITSLQKTDYPALEIIVVDNDSQHAETKRYFKKLQRQGIRILSYPQRFNYAAINNMAVDRATGDIIGLINNDVEAMDTQWLKTMLCHLLRPNVGAVGAKLLWPNGMVQHAGVVLGLHGLVGHIGNQWEDNDLGYFGYNQITREVSAVTAACLLCHKQDYLDLGGLDAGHFPVAFNDVDFCLRLREQGKRILWCAEAKLWHKESASRGRDDNPAKIARLEKEKNAFKQRWGETLYRDPYYNPNLNLDRFSHYGLAFPPRLSLYE